MKRPDNFDFAMDFLGVPESEDLIQYIEKLEILNEVARRVYQDLEDDGIYGDYALGEDLWGEFRNKFKDT
jgi:hypothetical protein